MPLDARLKRGFEHATSRPLDTEAALARVVETYHRGRRQQLVATAAVAAAAVLLLVVADRPLGWLEGMDRGVPPAEQREENARLRNANERVLGEGFATASTGRGAGRFADAVRGGPRRSAPLRGTTRTPARPGGAERSAQVPAEPILTREVSKEWAYSPAEESASVTTFYARPHEEYIHVTIDIGTGAGSSWPAAEVYEIVDGERQLLTHFCDSRSGTLDITPGAELEVHVDHDGCDGRTLDVNGDVYVKFYR